MARGDDLAIKRCAFGLIIAALVGMSLPAAAKDTVVESVWSASPVTIDGGIVDWNDVTPATDKGSGGKYALKNDGQDLYIVVVLADKVARSTIQFTGWKIFVSAGPKKVKDAGFLFMQKTLAPDELIASLEKRGEAVTEEKTAEIRKQKSYTIFVREPLDPKKGTLGEDAQAAPALFRSRMRGQAGIYEFKVPLSRIGGGAAPGATLKVGFEWGGMTKEIMKNLMAGRAGMSTSARQSQGSSDSGFSDQSGEGGYDGPDFSAMAHHKRDSKRSFWIDAKLAAAAK